ncbi:hypothetical protein AMTRI_Chr02g260900 [Amborella trichopoda]
MLWLTTLMATIGLACMEKEKLQSLRCRGKGQFNWQKATIPLLIASKTGTHATKKLTLVEMKEHRDKGLCYKYDKNFGLDHKCMSQQLFVPDGDADLEVNDQEG